MSRVSVVAVIALLPAAGATAARQPAQPTVAALKYWQAFAQLPPRDDAQQKRLADWRTTPLDQAARRLATDGEKSMQYLRRGAAISRCDWSLDYEDGVSLLLPHLDKARTLTLLTCLRARIARADGHPEQEVENLLAAMTLGRHVADPIMVSQLVGQSIESHAGEAIALLLPDLQPASVKKVAERLDMLPAGTTLDQTILTERDYFGGWTIRWLKNMEQNGERDIRGKVRELLLGNEDTAEVMKLLDDGSAKRLIEAMEALKPYYEEQRRLVALRRDQFQAQWPEFERKQSANPLAKLMMPALVKVIDARDRAKAKLELLKAAVAITRDGQPALAKHP
ncbi:MAG TPA: hypothetical protein VH120_00855, partial [Gemmataceae bacterium]|nr:hypothetical protein [Gemmataceae bacterium]